MGDAIRCPSCGGLNPAGAEWCGQCLVRFTRTPPPPPPAPVVPPRSAGGDAIPATAPAPASAPRKRGVFTVAEGGITWHCTICDNENPLDAPLCSVCGARFADVVDPPPPRIERDPNTVALYSLFFPGAGHWHLGLKPAAVARGVISTWVVLVAVLAVIGGSVIMATAFVLAAFGLWVVAAHDSYREARGEESMVILKPRMLVYVVLGLLVLMVVMLVSAGVRAGR